MANDPAFLFYPGDYLRDTQCLSERAQVAYDRIMCEHMRNICISQTQLDFFTKRLTPDEKSEVLMVVVKTPAGYQIPWIAESIVKRREYSESRRKNKLSKGKDKANTSLSYVKHMDNVIENENEIVIGLKKESKIIVKKVYMADKTKIIYDLELYFTTTGQIEDIKRANWDKFEEFMQENPGKIFDEDNHLYNAFKNFNTTAPKNGSSHKITFNDLRK